MTTNVAPGKNAAHARTVASSVPSWVRGANRPKVTGLLRPYSNRISQAPDLLLGDGGGRGLGSVPRPDADGHLGEAAVGHRHGAARQRRRSALNGFRDPSRWKASRL